MTKPKPLDLGRRERQIMEVVYARGEASVSDVLKSLPDPPSYSAVRAMLNLLQNKGHLRRKKDGKRYLYLPTIPRENARKFALKSLLKTFFNGSATQAVASLLDMGREQLSDEELDRLSEMIEEKRKNTQKGS